MKSTKDRLTSDDTPSASLGVHGQRQGSTAVVSSALAKPARSQGLASRPLSGESAQDCLTARLLV